MAADLRSKFLGAMVGGALGDAIGELAFSLPGRRELEAEVARRETLAYTDDTAMAIALAESLAERRGLDPDHLSETFIRHHEREPWRGYAAGPPAIFARARREGIPCAEAARQLFGGQGSFGNGAAMRVAPAGLFFHDAGDLYAQAALSAAPTHAHPVGVDGAAVLARAVALAVRAGPGEALPGAMFLEDLIGFARTHPLREKLLLARELIVKQAPLRRAAELLGWGVEADRSVPYAIYAFLKNLHSFADCLMGAVLYGGDCDTLGAMAGGLSGACLGIEAIPPAWRARLENRARIEALAERLLEARG